MQWNKETNLIYGHNNHDQAFAFNSGSMQLDYFTKIGPPAAWSPDGKILAHNPAGLVFYDARTGLPTTDLPMIMGAVYMKFSPDSKRLALIVTEDNQFDADAAMHIIENNKLLCSIDSIPQAPAAMECSADPQPIDWSMDSNQIAILTEKAQVEIWTISKKPVKDETISVSEKTAGILWGNSNVLICIGADRLNYLNIKTKNFISSCNFTEMLAAYNDTCGTEHPFIINNEDLLTNQFEYHPAFPIIHEGKAEWTIAFESGLVMCSDQVKSELDNNLAYVINNRWAWPYRWGDKNIVNNLDDLLTHEKNPLSEKMKGHILNKLNEDHAEEEEKNYDDIAIDEETDEIEKSFADLLVYYFESAELLDPGWETFASEDMRFILKYQARQSKKML